MAACCGLGDRLTRVPHSGDAARFLHVWEGRVTRARLLMLVCAAALFVVLVVVAVWAAGAVVGARRAADVDARLRLAVEEGRSLVAGRAAAADNRASLLARSPEVQTALASRDEAALRRLSRSGNGVAFVVDRRWIPSMPPEPSVRSVVDVFASGSRLGSVVVAAVLREPFLRDVRRGSRLDSADELLLVRRARVVAGPRPGATVPVSAGRVRTIAFAGRRSRAFAEPIVSGASPVELVALGRDPANPFGWTPALEAVLLALVLLVAGAALFARRLPLPRFARERRRLAVPRSVTTVRSAISLVGDTLAATHNPEALLPVILAAAIEATGAAGGELREGGRVVSRAGVMGDEQRQLMVDLGEAAGKPIQLLLWPRPGGFSAEARDAATWFVEQASIALENARLHRIVQQQAVTDELTELANRRSFIAALTTETSRANRFGTPLVLVLADIDDFKRVNDRFGHQSGDLVLREFARILRESVREVDLPVRFGGEEFALLLPDTDLTGGMQLAERLRSALAEVRIPTDEGEIRATASFGVAAYVPGAADEELLIEADACLYRAKAGGKNRVVTGGLSRRAMGGGNELEVPSGG
jgi:diguanylate cyclase (GGDEF)-like protein